MSTTPTCGILAGEDEIVGERCLDGGACHHLCGRLQPGTMHCARRHELRCAPLAASGLADDWSVPPSIDDPTHPDWPFPSKAARP